MRQVLPEKHRRLVAAASTAAASRLPKPLRGLLRRASARPFLREYYANVETRDLAGRTPAELATIAYSHLALARRRRGRGHPVVRGVRPRCGRRRGRSDLRPGHGPGAVGGPAAGGAARRGRGLSPGRDRAGVRRTQPRHCLMNPRGTEPRRQHQSQPRQPSLVRSNPVPTHPIVQGQTSPRRMGSRVSQRTSNSVGEHRAICHKEQQKATDRK